MASEASFTLAVAVSPPSATAPATQWPRCSLSSPSATDCRALVAAATWVRMSMQYLSSSDHPLQAAGLGLRCGAAG